MIDDVQYLDDEAQWDELALRIEASGVCGLDTEYHGWDAATGTPRELNNDKSPVGRTRVHVWSVALPSARESPLGFHVAAGWTLPARAIDHHGLRAALENPRIRKAVHNQSVDHHALANHGVRLRGGINTLGFVRWVRPDLINQPGRFKLKALMGSLLRRDPVCTFLELCSYERLERTLSWKIVESRFCACLVEGCRKRKPEGDVIHDKLVSREMLEVVKEKNVKGRYNLWEIVPGHPRWELLVKYALEDAVAAVEILELCMGTPNPAPWPYGGNRPHFAQSVEEAIIEMEATGFRVDVPWCTETAARAQGDEDEMLTGLFKWYVVNGPGYGPHRREDVDPIWSSPTQKIRLFDVMGFPRSPIWKKGTVKRGDVKMDGVAVEWIGANHPPARQLTKALLRLQRIRSGLKYLVKLRDSGGWVNPICGPAGDDDDRAGAVTGRLGIKGELEAAQLPTREDLDLYLVRKAIIA